jgi:hypothetical protein
MLLKKIHKMIQSSDGNINTHKNFNSFGFLVQGGSNSDVSPNSKSSDFAVTVQEDNANED